MYCILLISRFGARFGSKNKLSCILRGQHLFHLIAINVEGLRMCLGQETQVFILKLTRTYIHAHTRTRTSARRHAYTDTHACIHKHTRTYTHIPTRSNSCTYPPNIKTSRHYQNMQVFCSTEQFQLHQLHFVSRMSLNFFSSQDINAQQ